MASALSSSTVGLKTSFTASGFNANNGLFDSLKVRSASRTSSIVVRCQNSEQTLESYVPRRLILAGSLAIPSFLAAFQANALLDQDDDDSLLVKVKKDRLSRITQRTERGNFKQETGYIQDGIYNLSKVGKAIEDNDLSTASAILGTSQEVAWIEELKNALSKGSLSEEETSVANEFADSISGLQEAIVKENGATVQKAYVTSAVALSKWINLTGLSSQVVGL